VHNIDIWHAHRQLSLEEPMHPILHKSIIINVLWLISEILHVSFSAPLIAPKSPWQNPYVERLIGSIRRECLDHVIVLHERHLRRLLTEYFHYYHRWRTHRALAMDCPMPRLVQRPEVGPVREVPEVGGLHHHYERQAA
jgi:Integrase core domain